MDRPRNVLKKVRSADLVLCQTHPLSIICNEAEKTVIDGARYIFDMDRDKQQRELFLMIATPFN